ncbi:hypothetical protein DNH61_12775 [Paenibacillus sambharensis]|uniref:Uncharacterized protein n=1 Tax=Paenibacillus sambharensis TaxID=1803190 RepID=A0A2W1LKI9_9BACL|nr:CBO0543 family protein [Paenibacillus sambharensis]PZD95405.1 hypothetical protein DNH61_12775 [Paenibacillus sambharensis]
MFTTDRVVLTVVWSLVVGSFLFLVPGSKRRESLIVFFSCQMLTWSLSLLFVEFGLLTNPVREFQEATQTNFTFNYAFFPMIAVFYNLYFPERAGRMLKLAYMALVPMIATVCTLLAEHYTNLIHYKHFHWYMNWFVFAAGFYAMRRYAIWFFYGSSPSRKGGKYL